MHQFVAIVLFVALVQLNYACYITNCPIGGKRSLSSGNQLSTHQVSDDASKTFENDNCLVSTLRSEWTMFWSIDLLF